MLIPQARISLATRCTRSVWTDCRVAGHWSPGHLLAPRESSPLELELISMLGQGLIQPPLELEQDSELDVDQPLLIPLLESLATAVQTFPFFQFRS